MALTYRAIFRNCNYIQSITKPVKWSVGKNIPIRILASGVCYQHNYRHIPLLETKGAEIFTIRQCSTQGNAQKSPSDTEEKKLGLIQRFKQMYRDYWYVLLPVHMGTSAIWFGSLYYAVRSGVDVISILESIGVNDTLLTPLRDSSAGYFALAFAFYKLITPLRYAVTVGGTTYAIKKLTALGWIKPVPSRERIKEMLQEKKDNLQDRFQESKQHYQTQMKEKRTHMMDEMRRYKTEMRNMKNKVKKM
ncbi:uncharacterized protein C18orf19 homolog A-like [Manduca sexta]|uniref:DUF1279 domain-containing protein n=1 Tax=Manduca sexta TaxID=7130 RepID=A0A921ZGI4_MANSE|nr:uncharacterized protein C18orf19 homolog A-like [Manduca sexta]KAG6457588.1 hypothetical protein O3G_MSEX010398 [Manduca sexta]